MFKCVVNPTKIIRSFSEIGSMTLFLAMVLAADHGYAVERKTLHPVGEIVFITGTVSMKLVPEADFKNAQPKQGLVVGDVIKTGPNGRASILIEPETQLKVASNSTVMIKEIGPGREKGGALKTLLRLESGEVWTRSKGATGGLDIETPNATASIRGTEWSISVKDNESRVVVSEGKVQLSNESGTVTVGKNEQGVVVGNQAPVKSIVINPRDRIQWTYYLSEKKLLGFLRFRGALPGSAEQLFNEGKLDESAAAFKSMLSQGTEKYRAYAGLGYIELKRGELLTAKGWIERSLEDRENLPGLIGRSFVLISENVLDDAAFELRRTRDRYPADPLPYVFQSFLYTSLGDYPSALRECDEGLVRLPGDPSLLAFKADLYFILNKPEEAKQTIHTLLEKNPDSSQGLEKMGLYHRVVSGDAKQAEHALKRAIDLDPANDEALSKYADLLREQGHIEEALKLIEKALAVAPWNAMHHYIFGRLLADINRIDEARTEFTKSISLDPTFSRAYLGEGIVLLKEGKPDAALKELAKAGMFEPNLSEIHSFLAIAHYQNLNVSAALDELRRAEECDPLDSTPHQLASTIYTDLYMPVEAIGESRKVMELLPYRKASGEALLESSKNGAMSINYSLDFIDLAEWSLYYAQKALFVNPYSNTSHYGVALAYDKIGAVSSLQGFNEFMGPTSSEYLQGNILNVSSLNVSNRYETLIGKPGHYLTFGGSYAKGDAEAIGADVTASGDFGSRFPLTYWGYASTYTDSGHLDNNRTRETSAEIVLGYRPRYDHDIYLNIGYRKDKTGVPLRASKWQEFWDNFLWLDFDRDDDQELKNNTYWVQLGYHKRFGPESHLLASFRYVQGNTLHDNPDGLYDTSGFSEETSRLENTAVGLKHMVTLFDDHQISYGLDYGQVRLNSSDFWPVWYPLWNESSFSSFVRRSTLVHVYDRWAITPKVTLDAGLFFSNYQPIFYSRFNDDLFGSFDMDEQGTQFRVSPKIGVTIDLDGKGIFRMAYQKRSTTSFLGELAPVGTSGLIPPTFDIAFNEARDLQASVEYELGKNTFVRALGGFEKLSDIQIYHDNAQLWYARIALNQILTKNLSVSARYHYNWSRMVDGTKRQLYGIPKNSGEVRLTFVHPSETYITLRESYTGERFADADNTVKLKEYYLTDLYIQKEFFKKRVMASVGISNIFNQKYDSIDYPYSWYNGALPGRGTTVGFRLEYRL